MSGLDSRFRGNDKRAIVNQRNGAENMKSSDLRAGGEPLVKKSGVTRH